MLLLVLVVACEDHVLYGLLVLLVTTLAFGHVLPVFAAALEMSKDLGSAVFVGACPWLPRLEVRLRALLAKRANWSEIIFRYLVPPLDSFARQKTKQLALRIQTRLSRLTTESTNKTDAYKGFAGRTPKDRWTSGRKTAGQVGEG